MKIEEYEKYYPEIKWIKEKRDDRYLLVAMSIPIFCIAVLIFMIFFIV